MTRKLTLRGRNDLNVLICNECEDYAQFISENIDELTVYLKCSVCGSEWEVPILIFRRAMKLKEELEKNTKVKVIYT